MKRQDLHYDTAGRRFVDMTDDIENFCQDMGDGLLSVFAPHATVGIALIEVGAGSEADLASLLDRLLPRNDDMYSHRHGSPGHGADHLLPALVSPSLTLPVAGGRPLLGTRQHVVLVDYKLDNNRRTVCLSFIAG